MDNSIYYTRGRAIIGWPMRPTYITTYDLATWCGVSGRAVRYWANEGKIPFTDLAGHLAFYTDDAITFMRARGLEIPECLR